MVIIGDTKAWLKVPEKPDASFYACSRLRTSTSRPLSKLLRDCFDSLTGQVLSNSKYPAKSNKRSEQSSAPREYPHSTLGPSLKSAVRLSPALTLSCGYWLTLLVAIETAIAFLRFVQRLVESVGFKASLCSSNALLSAAIAQGLPLSLAV